MYWQGLTINNESTEDNLRLAKQDMIIKYEQLYANSMQRLPGLGASVCRLSGSVLMVGQTQLPSIKNNNVNLDGTVIDHLCIRILKLAVSLHFEALHAYNSTPLPFIACFCDITRVF